MRYETKEFYRTLSDEELRAAEDRMWKRMHANGSPDESRNTALALWRAAHAVRKEREAS